MAEMITGARTYIATPPVEPLGGGILAVANVVDDPDSHALMGAQYLSDACATAEEWAEWCTTAPAAPKVFDDEPELIEGDPFAVYAGVSCVLQRLDEGETRAKARFSYAEGRAVDFHVQGLFDTLATEITGGPFTATQAVGVAEAFAATVYGGVPTLVIPRQFVPCASAQGAIKTNLDGSLTTVQGSRVANITTPVTFPITDEGWLYVTGQITLLRGAVGSYSTPQQIASDGTFAPPRALAERLYVPLFDCLVAKVAVTCS